MRKMEKLGVYNCYSLFPSILLLLCVCLNVVVVSGFSYDHCQSYNNDENGNNNVELVHASKPLSSLTPNTFHQVCPGRSSTSISSPDLSFPICGDGSTFSFLVSSPTRAKNQDASSKILIEFQGGGACWDKETCNESAERLSFPEAFSDFSGRSCSEANAGVEEGEYNGEYPVNVLCAQQIGDVDFTTYHTIVVPYCTQDVFIGDAYAVYSDNDNDNRRVNEEDGENNNDDAGVYHHGAHNLMSVLRYVYKNFKNPSHIALTGCSAGGTALPIAYDLLNKHYNHILGRSILPTVPSVNINVISDSPVYLTPQYFLDNSFGNWNPNTILKKTRFNFNQWRYDEQYPTMLWDHILKRGPNNDQWGLVIHNQDPVEELFFEAMSGNYRRRRLDENDNNEDAEEEAYWWNDFSDSLNTIKSKHKNVDSFIIDGEGHCSFGLYYGLQQDGFQEWASGIFKEQRLLGHTSYAIPLFFVSFCIGGFLAMYRMLSCRKNMADDAKNSNSLKDTMLGEGSKRVLDISNKYSHHLQRFNDWPITAGYLVTITIYFLSMLVIGGITHPLDNPSLGPNAVILSMFGINNPTLILYKYQIPRLMVSSFLCSGILTYLLVLFCLLRHTRHIERIINNSTHFVVLSIILILGPNLAFATVSKGASCSSIPLVLAFNAFAICSKLRENPSNKLKEQKGDNRIDDNETITDNGNDTMEESASKEKTDVDTTFPRPFWSSLFISIITCFIFPFNSWFMILSAICVGALAGTFVFPSYEEFKREINEKSNNALETGEVHQSSISSSKVVNESISRKNLGLTALIFSVFFIILMTNRSRNIDMYKSPYLTGCNVVYSNQVSEFVNNYQNGNQEGNDRRYLQEDDNDNNMCAQFCVPHIVHFPFMLSVEKYLPSANLKNGLCHKNGYEEHIADKTFSRFGYSLDVSLYQNVDEE